MSSGLGAVVLSWTPPPNPYTYFLIAYSDNSSWPPKWGNPSVGNVTSYTVSGLGSGTYWFWVRAGNGCKPGSYAGPVSLGISGITGGGVAAGFSPGVLGTQENLNSGISTNAGGLKSVEGASTTSSSNTFNWWWLLLLLIFPFLWLLRIILAKMGGNENS